MSTADYRLFSAEGLDAELQSRQQQLAQSLDALSRLEPITPGCSAYQIIQQLDNTRLRYYQRSGTILPTCAIYRLCPGEQAGDFGPACRAFINC